MLHYWYVYKYCLFATSFYKSIKIKNELNYFLNLLHS